MYGLIDVLLNGHVIVVGIFIIIDILLLILNKKNNKVLIVLNLIPIIIGIVHFIMFATKGNIKISLSYYDTLYMLTFCFAFILLFIKQKKVYKLLTILLLPISLITFFLIGVNITRYYTVHNFTRLSYTDSFKKMVSTLKKEYVLNDYREIDYDELEKKYLPLIEEAEKNKDKKLYYETIFKFMDNFKDGHMGANCLTTSCQEAMKEYGINNYYGFDTVLLDNNKLVAIKVDKESDAYKKGLRDYFEITKRDDKDILKYLDDYYYHTNGEPVEYNEKLLNSTKIFYRGDDKTTITYIDEKNKTKTIEIESFDKTSTCFINTLLAYKELDNYTSAMLTDDIGYLNLSTEYTNRIKDLFSYVTGNTSYAKQPIIDNLNKLKKQGMKKLVIDLRGNGGGFFHISGAYASVFTDDEFTYSKAIRHHGEDKYKVKGSGEFKDIQIAVLVNAHTISAADTLLEILSRNPNVTIIGLMPSNNSSQEIGGQIYMSHSSINIFYPLFNTKTPDGKIYIDPDNKRKETIELDVKIPINKETIENLINNEDYVLDYATNYLKEGN